MGAFHMTQNLTVFILLLEVREGIWTDRSVEIDLVDIHIVR